MQGVGFGTADSGIASPGNRVQGSGSLVVFGCSWRVQGVGSRAEVEVSIERERRGPSGLGLRAAGPGFRDWS